MQSPFLFIVSALTVGMLFVSFCSMPVPLLFAGAFISLVCAWLSYLILRKTKLALYFILVAIFFCGSFLLSSAEKQYKENPLFNFDSSSYVDIYGTLYKSPVKGKDLVYLNLRVDRIHAGGQNFQAEGNLQVSIPQKNQDWSSLGIYDYIKISAKISGLENFYNFDIQTSANYYKSLNIHKKAYSKSPLLIEKIRPGKPYFVLRLISAFRTNLQKKSKDILGSLTLLFLKPAL